MLSAGDQGGEATLTLKADRIFLLRGKDGPELDGVTEWKNSKPLHLAELRGKPVVLYFWGTWCAGCLEGMPQLQAWAREHRERVQVVGVHDSSSKTVEELDRKLAKAREKLWQGAELELATCVGGKRVWEAYGVTGAPTMVLIDAAGKVVGKYNLKDARSREELEREIGAR
jgi:thiol-disulfide isomerase/thioredoxin